MEPEFREKKKKKTERWANNDVASFPYMQISGRPLTGGMIQLQKEKTTNFLLWELQAGKLHEEDDKYFN